VRARLIVIRRISRKNSTQVRLTEDQHPVQALAAHGANQAFRDESSRSLTLIKAVMTSASDARTSIHSRGAGMSAVDMFYLGLVLTAFVVFAVALAYYSLR
jgi:hypothetical protein